MKDCVGVGFRLGLIGLVVTSCVSNIGEPEALRLATRALLEHGQSVEKFRLRIGDGVDGIHWAVTFDLVASDRIPAGGFLVMVNKKTGKTHLLTTD
jgi:hypothetical protein